MFIQPYHAGLIDQNTNGRDVSQGEPERKRGHICDYACVIDYRAEDKEVSSLPGCSRLFRTIETENGRCTEKPFSWYNFCRNHPDFRRQPGKHKWKNECGRI